MRRAFKAVAVAALLAAAAAAHVPAAARDSHTVESHTFDHKTTAKKRFDLRVPAGAGRVRLRLRAEVREGEARIVVRDGQGRVLQEAHLTRRGEKPGYFDTDTGSSRADAGRGWTVEVELKEAVGSYEITWTTR